MALFTYSGNPEVYAAINPQSKPKQREQIWTNPRRHALCSLSQAQEIGAKMFKRNDLESQSGWPKTCDSLFRFWPAV